MSTDQDLEALSKEELIEKLQEHDVKDLLAKTEELERRVFDADTALEAEGMKLKKLENENKSLLSRAMEAEQQLNEAQTAGEKGELNHDAMKKKLFDLEQKMHERTEAEAETSKAIDELQQQLEKYKAVAATAEEEKANAEKNNELRLSTEHAFEELSRQYEELMASMESQQSRTERAEAEAQELRDKLSAMEARALQAESRVSDLLKENEDLKKQMESVKEAAKKDADARKAANEEVAARDQQLEELRKALEASKDREEKLAADLEALKLKSASWKKDAQRSHELEMQVRSLEGINERQADEIDELKDQAKEYRAMLRRMEEDATKRASEQVPAKQFQHLKQQHAELQLKFNTYAEKEKGWLKERQELLLKIKKLELELRNKNPSMMRMMEVEVQNQLLLGMLQKSSGGAAGKGKAMPSKGRVMKGKGKLGGNGVPRKLPPLRTDTPPTPKKDESTKPTPTETADDV